MPKRKNPLTLWASWVIGLLCILLLVGFIVSITSCSFLQVVNPTYTAQIQTPQGPIDVQIPNELPDFVTGQQGLIYPVAGNICVLMYSGVTPNSEGRIIDRYEFVVKCDAHKILALRATTMDTERFWIYIEGIPIPSSHKQVKEKIEGLIGRKI